MHCMVRNYFHSHVPKTPKLRGEINYYKGDADSNHIAIYLE